ncbi:glycoside hydrolase family 31 protein [Polychaeton citri CBS 116435]|uniref:alpha-glucosidase n=1 Tax=Polychaeton citri CBS 116435 TaxID=1314669 RepID=A0A9P4Q6G3_9PEZI|nr:glycoside hydrolase family 31 protein [Polychaeton citri CBS 116435]
MARFVWALLPAFVVAQSSTSQPADGLSTAAGTKTESIGTATVGTSTWTYSVPYTLPAAVDVGPNYLPNIKNASSIQAQDVCPGYKAGNVKKTEHGFTASLTLAGSPCNVYGTDIEDLTLSIDVQSSHRLHISIEPTYVDSSNISQFILAENLIPKPNYGHISDLTQDVDLQFSWTNEPTFAFTVLRKSTGDVLFDTRGSKLVYENQFIEFVSSLPENYNLYGLGEQMHGLRKGNNFTATMFAADAGDPIDGNIYGVHPFYLETRYFEVDSDTSDRTYVANYSNTNGSDYESYSHGVYLRNSHPMEAILEPTQLKWRTLGGSIDIYVFDGPSQPEVTKQYQWGAIGLPAMQQLWTFGFHQCRWGYSNFSELREVVDSYRRFDIPLETIWTDIDYMDQYRDFTASPAFPYEAGAEFLEQLHADGQHYIPIVDSAIYIPNPDNETDAYEVYTDGNAKGVFLNNPDGSQYIGAVWPGFTVFPDWFTGEAVPWWTKAMHDHWDHLHWDGIWIDMSEVSSFCIGSCGSGNLSLNPVHPPFGLPGEEGSKIFTYPEGFNLTNSTEAETASSLSESQASAVASATPQPSTSATYDIPPPVVTGQREVDNPPYIINNINGALAVHAVAPNATHHDGTEEYDVHSLFGHQILNATYQALLDVFPSKRPFIIGRSTFAGSGKWAGHWGGDNASLFAYMYFAISQALDFSLFGIPMFGVDTCGFNGNSDEELCNRWMQLSAFFPFYRNHNVLAAIPQEAYRWSSVIDASKTAMKIRYSLLPYFYTLFYQASTTGSTVMRALAWEFPTEPLLADLDHQFLLGAGIMVAPVLGQGLTSRGVLFPGVASGQVWYDWYTQAPVDAPAGENVTVEAPLGHIPVYIRGGVVLPQHEPGYTTADVADSDWSLIAALDGDGAAAGQLYIDDNVSLVPNATLIVDFTATNGSLYASSRGIFEDSHPLANVTILGVSSAPQSIELNGNTIGGAGGYGGNGTATASYNSSSQALSIQGLQGLTSDGAWAQDWVLSWS